MKGLVITLLFLMLPVACARLPEVRPAQGGAGVSLERCIKIYPCGDWQLLHAIEAVLPNGKKQTLLGLSQLSSERRMGKFVMMTVEGLVLFEAHLDGDIDIKRAVPPFDRKGMATGIIEDLRLIFFSPEPPAILSGIAADGATVCRFTLAAGGAQDIAVYNEHDWRITKYNDWNRTVRTVQPAPSQSRSVHGIPVEILLEASGQAGYRLRISLIEAQPISH